MLEGRGRQTGLALQFVLAGLTLSWSYTALGTIVKDISLLASSDNPSRLFRLIEAIPIIASIGLILLLTSLSLLSIRRVKSEYQALKEGGVSATTLLAALCATLAAIGFCNPLDGSDLGIDKFDREIGAGLIAGFDIGRVIGSYRLAFVFAAVLFALFLLLASAQLKESALKDTDGSIDLESLLTTELVAQVLYAIRFFGKEGLQGGVFSYSLSLCTLVVILRLAYEFSSMKRKVSLERYGGLIIILFVLGLPIVLVLGLAWQDGKSLFSVQLAMAALLVASIMATPAESTKGTGRLSRLRDAFMRHGHAIVAVACSIPLATSLYIEGVNVLNQHGVFVGRPRFWYAVVIAVCIPMLAAAVGRLMRGRGGWKHASYPLLVCGASALSTQISLQAVYSAHIFESANSGVPISGFLDFGQIPIVEHVGHHLMAGVWGGVLYGLVNGDAAGAVFNPYSVMSVSILSVLLYWLVSRCWDEDAALLTSLFVPALGYWSWFGWGILGITGAVRFYKRPTRASALVLWASLAWCVTYKADIGVSFGVACIGGLCMLLARRRDLPSMRLLGASLCAALLAAAMLWAVLCTSRGIDPVARFVEFVKVFASTRNWSYAGMGDATLTSFVWVYCLLPLTVVVSLCYALLSRSFFEEAGEARWLIVLVLGIAFLANYSRALVRHNLVESRVDIITWTAAFYFAVFAGVIARHRSAMLVALGTLSLTNGLMLGNSVDLGTSIADRLSDGVGQITDTWVPRDARGNRTAGPTMWWRIKHEGTPVRRVLWSDGLSLGIAPYKFALDNLLSEDETFLDFMGRSFAYAALGREDPVYVAQSPTMLSGELTQEMFLKELKAVGDRVPIAFLPNRSGSGSTIDDVPLNYKYYKVAEYIYANYRPLCDVGACSVWCLNDRYDELAKKVIEVTSGTETVNLVEASVTTTAKGVELSIADNKLLATSTDSDPSFFGLESCVDLGKFANQEVELSVTCASNTPGMLQLFYTTAEGEQFSEGKSVIEPIGEANTVAFRFPVTEHTRLRLDIPNESTVSFESMALASAYGTIDWGFDSLPPEGADEGDGQGGERRLHNYRLQLLPLIWAESDMRRAVDNPAICMATGSGNAAFTFNAPVDSPDGSYLHMRISSIADARVPAQIEVGTCISGEFGELATYNMLLEPGVHDYLIRVSSDYYWAIGRVNSVRIDIGDLIDVQEVRILEGD